MSKELIHISDWLEMHGEDRDPAKVDLFGDNPRDQMMQIFTDLGVVFDPLPDHHATMSRHPAKKWQREAERRNENNI